jgi:hypothetical protein
LKDNREERMVISEEPETEIRSKSKVTAEQVILVEAPGNFFTG